MPISEFWGTVTDWLRFGLGMVDLVIAFSALFCAFNALWVLYWLRSLSTIIITESELLQSRVQTLDSQIAQAILDLQETSFADFEPPSPFAAVIAQFLQEKLNPSIVAKEITPAQDEAGKFIKKVAEKASKLQDI